VSFAAKILVMESPKAYAATHLDELVRLSQLYTNGWVGDVATFLKLEVPEFTGKQVNVHIVSAHVAVTGGNTIHLSLCRSSVDQKSEYCG
jgi:hypothetical protein